MPDSADPIRARVCTRVIRMLTPAEGGEEVASFLAATPVAEKKVVREKSLCLVTAAGLFVAGMAMTLFLINRRL